MTPWRPIVAAIGSVLAPLAGEAGPVMACAVRLSLEILLAGVDALEHGWPAVRLAQRIEELAVDAVERIKLGEA